MDVSSSSGAAPRAAPVSRPDLLKQTGAPTHSHPHRFPRRNRLTRGADFEVVFKEGRRSADQLFTVLYRPSGLRYARLGMTASAKRLRTAVARNRIRRLIRRQVRRDVTDAHAGRTGLRPWRDRRAVRRP